MAPITATMADNGKSQDLVAILDAGAQYGKVITITSTLIQFSGSLSLLPTALI